MSRHSNSTRPTSINKCTNKRSKKGIGHLMINPNSQLKSPLSRSPTSFLRSSKIKASAAAEYDPANSSRSMTKSLRVDWSKSKVFLNNPLKTWSGSRTWRENSTWRLNVRLEARNVWISQWEKILLPCKFRLRKRPPSSKKSSPLQTLTWQRQRRIKTEHLVI